MFFPTLLLAFSLTPAQTVQRFDCVNFLDRTIEIHSNAEGLRIALRVHAADDHIKATHLCQTDYSFVVTRPDGTTSERKLESIDDSWGRSVKFWIDGFALKGRRVIATIVEQGKYPIFQIVVYCPESDKVRLYDIPRAFMKQISSSCQESLRAIGMTRLGNPVVGFRNSACSPSTAAWKLEQGPLVNGVQTPSRPIRLTDRSVIEPIVAGKTAHSR